LSAAVQAVGFLMRIKECVEAPARLPLDSNMGSGQAR
jgi:hypothetical protein